MRGNNDLKIVAYEDKYRKEILSIWEESVLATHNFLSPSDFKEIKKLVNQIDFNHFLVFCALINEQVVGFLGVADGKVEMLFISPIHAGKGIGKKLMHFAIMELKANKVDVNEQNEAAVAFYRKLGFEVYERTAKDDQGKDYPLLRMRL